MARQQYRLSVFTLDVRLLALFRGVGALRKLLLCLPGDLTKFCKCWAFRRVSAGAFFQCFDELVLCWW
jgi:hypothetical protein